MCNLTPPPHFSPVNERAKPVRHIISNRNHSSPSPGKRKPSSPAFAKQIFLLLTFLVFSLAGCKKDFIERDIPTPSKEYVLNPVEKRFFDLHNAAELLNRRNVSGRSGFPESLLRVYNDMLAANDGHHFVVGVVERIGYPLWESATVDENHNGSTYLVNIPFVKPGVTNVQAILTCLVTGTEGDIRYGVKSKQNLDAILLGQAPIGPGTCRDCMDFGAFNYSIFGEQGELYEDLTCDACFPETDGGNLNGGNGIVERSCETVNITYCIWDEPTGPLPTTTSGGGGGGDGYGDWFVWNPGVQPGDFVFWGPFGGYDGGTNTGGGGGGGGIGGGLFDININLGGLVGSVGSFFKRLFTPAPRCPWKLTDPNGSIKDREGEVVYVCQTFTAIMCLNGGWWEIVESWPCPECDGNLTLEEHHGMLCSEKTLTFLAANNLNMGVLKQYGINLSGCCEEGEFDEGCGLRAVFEGVGLSEEEINSIFGLGVQAEIIAFLVENNFGKDIELSDLVNSYEWKWLLENPNSIGCGSNLM